MSSLWESRLATLIEEDKQREARAAKTLDSLHARLQQIQNELRSALSAQQRNATALTSAYDELVGMKDDPTVVVRDYGANIRVYHSSRACGWVGVTGYRELLWGEARARGLKPCSSCGWAADKAAKDAHKASA